MSLPCSFIVAWRFLRTASLSCASAVPPAPATRIANAAPNTCIFTTENMLPPCVYRLRQRLPSSRTKARSPTTGSPLRDRDFNMLFEGGAFAEPLEPGLEVLQRGPL